MEERADVCQIIPTIQGEGGNIGEPSLLIRFNGCNLTCPFCDTKWANLESDQNKKSIDETFKLQIEIILSKYPNISTIMFTGGEPLLQVNSIIDLSNLVSKSQGKETKIHIETNGTHLFRVINSELLYKNVHFSISPKLLTSCFQNKLNFMNIINLYKKEFMNLEKIKTDNYYFKFVYHKTNGTLIKEFILHNSEYINRNNTFMMPMTPERSNYKDQKDFYNEFRYSCHNTINFCLKYGFRYSPREHIWLFDKDNKDEELDG